MYRGSRSGRSRGLRSRGSHHSHSFRGASTHLSRYQRRSESPEYHRTSRARKRSSSRESKYERRWSRENDRRAGRYRIFQSRERSRSPSIFNNRAREGQSRSRSRDHGWESREDSRERRRHRHEDSEEQHEIKPFRKRPHSASNNGHPCRNDRYHWTRNQQSKEQGGSQDEDTRSEGIHDLREIIKRRDVTRSPGNKDYEIDETCEKPKYFKAFVPNVTTGRRSVTSRWLQEDEEMLSSKQSIHNNTAHDEGQFVSSKDSHPDIPYFDGNDQDLTPRQFVKQIEDLGYANGWSSSELKCQMAAKIVGSAREWFLKDELMNEPWEKVKVQFIKMHPTDMDYFQQLRKMVDRTMHENESFSNYFTFKTMLMSAVGITGRKAVSCLIGGLLNQDLEAQCFQKNFATPELLFEYLNARKEGNPPYSRSSEPSTHDQRDTPSSGYKKPLLKTPPGMNNLYRDDAHAAQDFTNESFAIAKPDYETKHLLTIKMKNQLLDAYNDTTAQCVTIKEESAKLIHMEYSRRRTTIIGFRGVPQMALGDCDTRIGVDQASVIAKVYIVPNICQDKPVVVGRSLREHLHLVYHESPNCVAFKQKAYPSTFATNEKRKEKSNHIK